MACSEVCKSDDDKLQVPPVTRMPTCAKEDGPIRECPMFGDFASLPSSYVTHARSSRYRRPLSTRQPLHQGLQKSTVQSKTLLNIILPCTAPQLAMPKSCKRGPANGRLPSSSKDGTWLVRLGKA